MKELTVLVITGLLVFAGLGLLSTTAEAQGQAFLYSVKFVCGQQTGPLPPPPREPGVKPGNYATAVNIHNFNASETLFRKKAVIANPQGEPPGVIGPFVQELLLPNQALEVDCSNIVRLLPVPVLPPFITGFVEIVSPRELSVVGVYTARVCSGADPDPCSVLGDVSLAMIQYRQPFTVPLLGAPSGQSSR